MYKITKPTTTGIDAYTSVVATIRDEEEKTYFTNGQFEIERVSGEYQRIGQDLAFDSVETENFTISGLSPESMSKLYGKLISNKGVSELRNSIKNAAERSLCPYCGRGDVYELDHYLPKSQFSAVAVDPSNLVPSCRDCNDDKGAYSPCSESASVLHPYFDQDAYTTRWLFARLSSDENGEPSIDFYVDLDDENLADRLEAHMKVFKLRGRYKVWAARELADFDNFIKSNSEAQMSKEDASSYLLEQSQLHANKPNSWLLSTLQAMAESDWFLSEYLGLS